MRPEAGETAGEGGLQESVAVDRRHHPQYEKIRIHLEPHGGETDRIVHGKPRDPVQGTA